jgi:phosphoglycerate kinase
MIQYVTKAAAGLLMEKELEYLGKAVSSPDRPCVAIIGGAKVSDKIEVIRNMLKIVDKLLIGGAMAYTFLKARGEETGKSLVEDDKLELAKELMSDAGMKLMLPVDHAVSPVFEGGGEPVYSKTIPAGHMALDIGPETVEEYRSIIAGAKTVIWNGPMGVFEKPPFDRGTVALAKAVAESGATSIVGGGDSEKAIKAAGVSDRISHISTGGGASLEFLGGTELPGVAALTDK